MINESYEEFLEDDMSDDLEGLVGTTMHLVLDDETEMEAVIIAAFEVEGYEDAYIALLPLIDEEEEESDVILYRLEVEEDGSPLLASMESDEEYEAVAEAFYEELNKMEREEEEE